MTKQIYLNVCYDEEIHKMREAEYNQEIGEERGKEIGKQQKALSIAEKLYHSGMSIEQIHDITEIDKCELSKLLDSNENLY